MLQPQCATSPSVQYEQFSLSLMALTELGTLCLAVNQFKVAAGSNPPLQLLQVFCFVAAHPGCLQQDMQKVTGMSESSCSRMVKWLGAKKADGSPGLCLIKIDTNPKYWKQNVLTLTPKGEMLADLIVQHL